MRSKTVKNTVLFILIVVFFILLFIQVDSGIKGLKLYYFFLPLFFIMSLFAGIHKFVLFNKMSIYFFILALINLFAYSINGINIDSIRYLFMTMSFFTGLYLYKYIIRYEDLIIKIVTNVYLGILVLRILIFFEDTKNLILYGRHHLSANYIFLTVGTLNIEVTFMAFMVMLQKKQNMFYLMAAIAFFYSYFYESRSGILLLFLAFIMNYYRRLKFSHFLVGLSLVLLLILGFVSSDSENPLIHRFTNIQQEVEFGGEGVGRLGFYYGAYDILQDNIFGYGIGNSLIAMSNKTGISYRENNVHNIYLQNLLDNGFIAWILLLLITFYILKNALQDKFSFVGLRIATAYLIIGLVEFTGYDVVGWLFIGLSYIYIEDKKRKIYAR